MLNHIKKAAPTKGDCPLLIFNHLTQYRPLHQSWHRSLPASFGAFDGLQFPNKQRHHLFQGSPLRRRHQNSVGLFFWAASSVINDLKSNRSF